MFADTEPQVARTIFYLVMDSFPRVSTRFPSYFVYRSTNSLSCPKETCVKRNKTVIQLTLLEHGPLLRTDNAGFNTVIGKVGRFFSGRCIHPGYATRNVSVY